MVRLSGGSTNLSNLALHLHLHRAQVRLGHVDLVHSLPGQCGRRRGGGEEKEGRGRRGRGEEGMKAERHLELTTSLARILQTSLSPFLAASFMDLVTLASSLRMAVTWRVAGDRAQVTGHR